MPHTLDPLSWPPGDLPPTRTVGGDSQGALSSGFDSPQATQLLQYESDYLDDRPDIGRAIGEGVRELFISTEPATALEQQFEFRRPSFVALHDLNCTTSRKLLAAVAASFNRPVHRLEIRRHGYGTTYASIEFVDCPSSLGVPVRLYSTDIDADTQTRQALARVLMGHSVITVMMVGDMASHTLTQQLDRLRQQMAEPSWSCRHLQFMPLFPSAWLEPAMAELGRASGAETRLTPQVTRPLDAWTFLSAAWNQLQAQRHPHGKAPLLGPLSVNPGNAAATMPRAAPAAAAASSTGASGDLERLVQGIADLPGVTSCCVFELTSSRTLAQVGMEPAPVELARRGTTLMALARNTRKQLGLPGQADEVLIMGGAPALAVRALTSRPELAVHVAFTPAKADWPVLRPRIMALDATLQPRAAL
jgi:hypothetical protein